MIVSHLPKTEKPTIGFQARFFITVQFRASSWETMACATAHHKNEEKHDRTMSFCWGRTPGFAAETGHFLGIFTVKLFIFMQRVIHESLARLQKPFKNGCAPRQISNPALIGCD
jgi:hypothetical protein